jgi:spermidine synthase
MGRRRLLTGPALALALSAVPAGIGLAAVGGTELVVRVESLYNDISLFKDANGYYILTFGAKRLNYVESRVNPKDELELPVYYTQSMTAGLAYAEKLEDAAIIGLGGGRTAWYLHKSVPGLKMTAAELDPEVVKIAEKYLNIREEPGFDIDIRDGRIWLKKTDGLYDFILVDAYRGSFVPFHLLTSEFYKLVASKLKPGGVAAQNVEPSTMLFDSAVATIKSAFDNVEFYKGAGNIVIIAYNGPAKERAELERIAAERQAKYGFRYDLTEVVSRRFDPDYDKSTEPLTDDFAPVDDLKATARHNDRDNF